MNATSGLNFVFIGLSITSTWGNGHATTYRSLIAALARRGHRIVFLERDVPWYAENRDLRATMDCRIYLYHSVSDLKQRLADQVRAADVVMVGSYVPDGIEIGRWVMETARGVTAFYDIDTPITIDKIEKKCCTYLNADLIARYDLYFSFTGGPFLEKISETYGIARAHPLYCCADPAVYYPTEASPRYDLGYMGTYSPDRQPALEHMLVDPARIMAEGRFIVAGPQYPEDLSWPATVERVSHIAPRDHREFYNAQRFTLNLTRADMIRAGYSPSVRMFEAAACGTPMISDPWSGLDTLFVPGQEILLSRGCDDTLNWLRNIDEHRRREIGRNARAKVLGAHTPGHRAAEMEAALMPLLSRSLPEKSAAAHSRDVRHAG